MSNGICLAKGIIWEKGDNSNWRVYISEELLTWVDPIDKMIILLLCGPVWAIHCPVVDQTVSNQMMCCMWFRNEHSKNRGVYIHDACDGLTNYMTRCDHDGLK